MHIGIGSNLGDRQDNCLKALEMLKSQGLIIKKISSFYETKPWGVKEQPIFINLAIEVETAFSPDELLCTLKNIENTMGRKQTIRWGPRVIDLDILFYGDEIIDTEELQIPHRHLHERDFVLIPLNEISPDKVHPILKKTVKEIKEELRNA